MALQTLYMDIILMKQCKWCTAEHKSRHMGSAICRALHDSAMTSHDDVTKWCEEFTGPGELPAQRPVMRNFDVFFGLRLNKQLSKQPRGWWFETHRGHYDVNVMGTFSAFPVLWEVTTGRWQIPLPKGAVAEVFQNDYKNLNPNLAASRLHEILW